MLRWCLILILVAFGSGSAQDSNPQQQTPPGKPGELQKERPQPKTSDKDAAPPEEDTSMGATTYSFNPLQAKKDIEVGNLYAKKHSYRAAASRYLSATKYNDGDAEAWLRLGEMDEKLRNKAGAHEAYAKYLEIASDAKNAAEIKKRLDKLK
jgi:tetratricopeptide (TPR) repeat protein